MAYLLGQEARARSHLGNLQGMLEAVQLSGYAAQVAVAAGQPAKAEHAARQVIASCDTEPGAARWLGGRSLALVQLGFALIHPGNPCPDVPCHAALQALQEHPSSGLALRPAPGGGIAVQ